MFDGAESFNQDISKWTTSNVSSMSHMFRKAYSFDQPLNDWDISGVQDLQFFFYEAREFNQPLDKWDTSNVTNMTSTFDLAAKFNQPLNDWDVSSVTTMQRMFEDAASFNQPLDNWTVSAVTSMDEMFQRAANFDQPLEDWDFGQVTKLNNMLDRTGLSCENYANFRTGAIGSGLALAENNSSDAFFPGYDRTPCLKNWENSYSTSPALVLEFEVDALNSDGHFEVQIPISGGTVTGNVHVYNSDYQFKIGSQTPIKSVSASANVVVTSSGVAVGESVFIEFSGSANTLGKARAGSLGDIADNPGSWKRQLKAIRSWGNISWTEVRLALNGATVIGVPQNIPAGVTNLRGMFSVQSSFNQDISMWDVSNVTNMRAMFNQAPSFNQPLNNWAVSKVTEMSSMFYGATSFDKPLDQWNVSNVTDMRYMFAMASNFNQPLNSWTMSKVTKLEGMFFQALNFNQDLSNWDVSKVTIMGQMFDGASSFDQNLSNWDISSIDLNIWSMELMFDDSALSCSNYDAFLIGIVATAPSKAITLGGAQYTEAAADARQALIDKGWTLNDSPCPVVQQNQTGVGGSQIPTSQMPTLAPMPTIDQSVITVAPGSEIRVTGQNFNLIVSAEIAGESVSLSGKTGEAMTLAIPTLEPGEYTLNLMTTNGKLSVQGFIKVSSTAVTGESLNAVISSLNPWSSWLNKRALAKVEAAVQDQTVVTCIAYNDRPGLAARKKALSRAMHACRIADQLGIETRVFVYGKGPQLADTVKILFR
jgi:surface protein